MNEKISLVTWNIKESLIPFPSVSLTWLALLNTSRKRLRKAQLITIIFFLIRKTGALSKETAIKI